jgi:diguanylate cyclase (GGDEF)-like protein
MFKTLINRIPEKYRILVFLVSTSCVGVSLILVAVYNASSELEVIHEIENMHRFATAQLGERHASTSDHQGLLSLSDPSYQVLVIRDEKVLADSHENTDTGWRFQLSELNESRVNENGGYMEFDDQMLTWTMLPTASDGTQLVILHHFSSTGIETLFHVYTKRLLVPALFYIWLMVWMGYIVRFLTHKLSEQKRAMEHMALHDTLTGLPNRNLLNDRLNTMREVAKRDNSNLTIVMMDLDDFKKINDTYGHTAGDALLKEVAARLNACLRPQDTVCRLGGDEFIFLLDDMQDDSSLEVCKRISAELSKPINIQGTQINIGSSMGIVEYSDYNDSPDALIHKADQAMYEVKAKGGGIHMYDATFDPGHESFARAKNVA